MYLPGPASFPAAIPRDPRGRKQGSLASVTDATIWGGITERIQRLNPALFNHIYKINPAAVKILLPEASRDICSCHFALGHSPGSPSSTTSLAQLSCLIRLGANFPHLPPGFRWPQFDVTLPATQANCTPHTQASRPTYSVVAKVHFMP